MGGFSGGKTSSGSGGGGGGPSYSGMGSIGSGGTKTKSKSKSKSKTTSTTNNREDNRTSQYTNYSTTQIASGKAKVAADIAKDNATAFKNLKYERSKAPSILARGLDYLGISRKAFDINKSYYEKNVSGKNNFTTSPEDFKRYMAARGTGSVDTLGRPTNNAGGGNNNTDNPQGIEFAKAATGSATISDPGEIQKNAANTKGLTDTTMSAAQTNVANKRKGRKATNFTAKKTLANNYTLSKKTLLG